jgi:hypothetical protein
VKLATAVSLGAANTRVRDYADIYTLITSREIDDEVVRKAALATTAFRGTVLRPLSQLASELVVLRSSAYTAYRSALGLSGLDLPKSFADLVQVVATFGDRVLADLPR